MSRLKHRWLIVFLFVILFTVSEKAQTRDDLRQKYKSSSAIETFEVRTGIVAIVFYDQSRRVNYIMLHPPITLGEYQVRKMEMPEKIVEETIEEIIPMSKRGKMR
ncbi:MAG TPA: hypothetical protein VF596_11810 [Pyrinomonadaceae bacterium]|jgi:hypothetical protein